MRVTPTLEQKQYLASIGAVSGGGRGSPRPPSTPPARAASPATQVRRAVNWWIVIVVVTALMMLLARTVRADEPRQPRLAPGGEPALRGHVDARLRRLEARLERLHADAEHERWVRTQLPQAVVTPATRKLSDDAVVGANIALGGMLILLAVGLALLGRRVHLIEEQIGQHLTDLLLLDAEAHLAAEVEAPVSKPATAPAPDGPEEPVDGATETQVSPMRALEAFTTASEQRPWLAETPHMPTTPWTLAMATHQGFVRSENQDFGIGFRVAGRDVLVVADGCGGIPHGRKAALVAGMAAAAAILKTYAAATRFRVPLPASPAIAAIQAAEYRLAFEGKRLGITGPHDGLRTTLIIVIADADTVAYAYIGDGGGVLLRASGEAESFLMPQKASAVASNVLAASLGPVIEGAPVSGTLVRRPGDLVVVGTDGVFDRVPEHFVRDMANGCELHDGDLQVTAERVLAELAGMQDAAGYICDDNLTLGLLGTGVAPTTARSDFLPRADTPVDCSKQLEEVTR